MLFHYFAVHILNESINNVLEGSFKKKKKQTDVPEASQGKKALQLATQMSLWSRDAAQRCVLRDSRALFRKMIKVELTWTRKVLKAQVARSHLFLSSLQKNKHFE